MNENKIIKFLQKLSFSLSNEEIILLQKEFEILEIHLDTLNELVKDKDLAPLVFPFELEESNLREDIPLKPLRQDEVLKNASDKQAGQIKIPKVL